MKIETVIDMRKRPDGVFERVWGPNVYTMHSDPVGTVTGRINCDSAKFDFDFAECERKIVDVFAKRNSKSIDVVYLDECGPWSAPHDWTTESYITDDGRIEIKAVPIHRTRLAQAIRDRQWDAKLGPRLREQNRRHGTVNTERIS